LKQLQGLVKQHQADKKHHSKMKQQNFHISGVDYDYLAAAGVQKSIDHLEINPSLNTIPVYDKSLTALPSPMKPPKP